MAHIKRQNMILIITVLESWHWNLPAILALFCWTDRTKQLGAPHVKKPWRRSNSIKTAIYREEATTMKPLQLRLVTTDVTDRTVRSQYNSSPIWDSLYRRRRRRRPYKKLSAPHHSLSLSLSLHRTVCPLLRRACRCMGRYIYIYIYILVWEYDNDKDSLLLRQK